MKTATHTIKLGSARGDLFDKEPAMVGRGFRAVKVGIVEGDVTLYVDANALRYYARKALGNKGGKCRMGNGSFELVVTNRREVRV